MGAILILPACLLAGVLLRASGRVPDGGHAPLNAFVINLALPALTLLQLHGASLDARMIAPVAMPWLGFLLAAAVLGAAGRLLRMGRGATGALILCGGLGNTSFVGLPMIQAFYGPSGVPAGVLADQLGTFLALSTLGMAVAAAHSGEGREGVGVRGAARRLCAFPPFQATAAALLLMPVPFPDWLSEGLRGVGAAVVPVALCSVGLQLRLGDCRAVAAPLALGLAFKLLVAPAAALAAFAGIGGAGGEAVRVGVFEMAMGPQIGAAIVAMEYGLDRRIAAAMVGVGIPASLLTAPAWYWLLSMAVP